MIDRLKQFREPATVVALLVAVVDGVINVVRFSRAAANGSLTQSAQGVTGLFSVVDGVVLTALVLSCALVAPRTRHARQLAGVSMVLLALSAVAGAVLLVLALLGPGGSFSHFLDSIGGITDIILKGLMAWVLYLAFQATPATAASAPAGQVETKPAPEPEPEASAIDPARQPTWAPDVATGVVWRRASEAATGGAATAYGTDTDGWTAAGGDQVGIPASLRALPGDPAELEAGPQGTQSTQPTTAARQTRIVLPSDTPSVPRTGAPSWNPADDVTRRG